MLALKKARKLIESNPTSPASKTLIELVRALDESSEFVLADIYQLDHKHFEVALEILTEWRLDRHYAKRLRLVAMSKLFNDLVEASLDGDVNCRLQPKPE